MEFSEHPYQPGETIAAISTPPGEGGISIIRVSGNEALAIADRVFSGSVATYHSHTAHLGYVINAQGERVDQALLLLMCGPNSYTGEDTVELQCHGGMIASKKVLETLLEAGARAAFAGEFTFKAYMNGKLDLAQAEAVQKMIHAKNEQAFQAAEKHLEGGLSKKIHSFQSELVRLAAILEAWVDFPEEGLEFATEESLLQELKEVYKQMEALAATFEDGRRVDQGISLCICGAPNVGKSSLMNALLKQERAIVTPVAGTTRDLLHEPLSLGGLHFTLTDTAGLRQTDELVEKEGIRRSERAIQEADVILLVLDGSRALQKGEEELIDSLPKEKTLALWNKNDLPNHFPSQTPFPYEVSLSAKQGEGLERVKKTLDQLIWKQGAPEKDQVMLTTARHHQALQAAMQLLQVVVKGLQKNLSPEFLTADLRGCLKELGRILGSNISEEILSSIFSQFCIGK